ncbi:MAG: hypothetical protein ABI151_05100 [Chitinophagaceae bacterium]
MNLLKKVSFLLIIILIAFGSDSFGQCSICSRTAQQLGERPAKALNTGVLYLAAAPLMIAGFIGYRWWKSDAPESKARPIQ